MITTLLSTLLLTAPAAQKLMTECRLGTHTYQLYVDSRDATEATVFEFETSTRDFAVLSTARLNGSIAASWNADLEVFHSDRQLNSSLCRAPHRYYSFQDDHFDFRALSYFISDGADTANKTIDELFQSGEALPLAFHIRCYLSNGGKFPSDCERMQPLDQQIPICRDQSGHAIPCPEVPMD